MNTKRKITDSQQPENPLSNLQADHATPFIFQQQTAFKDDNAVELWGKHAFHIVNAKYARVVEISGGSDAGIFNCMTGAFGILFSRYSSLPEVVMESPYMIKPLDPDGWHGTIPISCKVHPGSDLGHYLKTTAEAIVNSYWYQQPPDQFSLPALLKSNILISYLNIHDFTRNTDKYDLVICMERGSHHVAIEVTYRRRNFEDSFIKNMQGHLERLLEYFASEQTQLSDIDILTAGEYAQIATFNRTYRIFPDVSIIELFETQVKNNPSAMALVFNDISYTYDQLNIEANKLRFHLVNTCGLKKGDIVAIMTTCSPHWVIGIIGILKAGCSYLPVDPESVAERQASMLKEAGVKVLLTNSEYLIHLSYFEGQLFALDLQLEGLAGGDSNSPVAACGADTAYVIYTSGSTGVPKGVMVSNSSLVNLCYWHIRNFTVNSRSRATVYANVSFDASVWELWPYLLCGACIYPIDEKIKLEIKELGLFLKNNDITHCFLPTPICMEVCKQHVDLNDDMFVLTGGDQLRSYESNLFKLVNNYGPTEATVVATSVFLKGDAGKTLIPIGKPIDNTQILILDAARRMVPLGVEGEIYIAGKGLAKGYLNNPVLTDELFVKNPYGKPHDLMYRTGDMGIWLEDGNILFKGRKDSQVKIKGFRIELGEIETKIGQFEGIEDAKVLVGEDTAGDRFLCCYYITKDPVSSDQLSTHLACKLPPYMIPSHFCRVEKFPLTMNGKIDNKSLLALRPERRPDTMADLGDPLGRQMTEIWNEVLGETGLGLQSNFFSHGGDSIKAIRLIYEVNRQFASDLKLMDIFRYDTPKQLLLRMNEIRPQTSKDHLLKDIEQEMANLKSTYLKGLAATAAIEDVYPVSDIQLGMLYHSQYGQDHSLYHDQIVHQVRYTGFDPARLKKALFLMSERHEILRTAFNLQEAEIPVQLVFSSVAVDYLHQDISTLGRSAQEKLVNQFIAEDRAQPFDIEQPGLWRVRTFALGNDIIVLIFICHHAIIDGWSDATFSTELNNTYQALSNDECFRPSKLGCNYRDYVFEELAAKKDPAAKEFWRKELADFQRTNFVFALDDNDSVARSYNLDLGLELKEKLIRFSHDHNISLRVICFSVYLQVISTFSLNETIVVGLHTHNRPLHPDSDKMLGCFLNSIPFRFISDKNRTALKYLSEVNEKVLKLAEFNNLSLLEIAKLHPDINRDQTENPFFDTLFAFLDFHVYQSLHGQGEEFSSVFGLKELDIPGHGLNNTHLNFIVNFTLDEFNLLIFYKSTQMNPELIDYIGQLFRTGIEQTIIYPERFISAREIAKTEKALNKELPRVDFNL